MPTTAFCFAPSRSMMTCESIRSTRPMALVLDGVADEITVVDCFGVSTSATSPPRACCPSGASQVRNEIQEPPASTNKTAAQAIMLLGSHPNSPELVEPDSGFTSGVEASAAGVKLRIGEAGNFGTSTAGG